MRDQRPHTFVLTDAEAEHINMNNTWPETLGGRQDFNAMLRTQIADGNRTIRLTDEEFGKLWRRMNYYTPGGYQRHLAAAFDRCIDEQRRDRRKRKARDIAEAASGETAQPALALTSPSPTCR